MGQEREVAKLKRSEPAPAVLPPDKEKVADLPRIPKPEDLTSLIDKRRANLDNKGLTEAEAAWVSASGEQSPSWPRSRGNLAVPPREVETSTVDLTGTGIIEGEGE